MLCHIHAGGVDAQGTLRSFVLAKAKKAKSAEDLLSGLQSLGQGFPSGPETATFAQQLFAQTPRAQQANVRTRLAPHVPCGIYPALSVWAHSCCVAATHLEYLRSRMRKCDTAAEHVPHWLLVLATACVPLGSCKRSCMPLPLCP